MQLRQKLSNEVNDAIVRFAEAVGPSSLDPDDGATVYYMTPNRMSDIVNILGGHLGVWFDRMTQTGVEEDDAHTLVAQALQEGIEASRAHPETVTSDPAKRPRPN